MTTSTPQAELLQLIDQRAPNAAERVPELLASGAQVDPPGAIAPIFFALRSLNVGVVKALMTAGANLETRLAVDWTDWDDDAEVVIAAKGTTARQFYASFEKAERAHGDIPAKRLKWLEQMTRLVGAPVASPKPSKKGKAGFDGQWKEVRNDQGHRRGAVKDGGILDIKGATFKRTGSITVGLPTKGKLTVRGEQRAYVDEDLEWSIVLSADTLTITSPSEADEEHGVVFVSILERV